MNRLNVNWSGKVVAATGGFGAMGAVKAAAGMGGYPASKAGVAKLTEAPADELKDRGVTVNVTVNALLPGTIDTARSGADMPNADFSRRAAPRGASGDVIACLMSDSGAAVTGAWIPVAGRA